MIGMVEEDCVTYSSGFGGSRARHADGTSTHPGALTLAGKDLRTGRASSACCVALLVAVPLEAAVLPVK